MHIPIALLGVALLMMGVERAQPSRAFPKVVGWMFRAILFNSIQVGVVYAAGVGLEPWFQRHRPWSADGLGLLGGSAVG
jgi:hypothetical protein